MDLQKYLLQNLTHSIIDDVEYDRIITRIKQGKLIRDENPLSHFGGMFIPFNTNEKKVFVVNHKKAGSWIFPGGHMDKNELPYETAAREIREELGVEVQPRDLLGPICVQVCDINTTQICKEHYDVFFAFPVTKLKMNIDMHEFLNSGWFTVDEAMKKIEQEYYHRSLQRFVTFMKW